MFSDFLSDAMIDELKSDALDWLLEYCFLHQEGKARQRQIDGAVSLFELAARDGRAVPFIPEALKTIARRRPRLYVVRGR